MKEETAQKYRPSPRTFRPTPAIKGLVKAVFLVWMAISIACNFPSAQKNQTETLGDDRLQTLVPRLQASAMADLQTPVSGENAPGRSQATLQTTASPPEEIAPYLRSSSGDQFIFPDSEVIYSPSVAGFDIEAFVTEAGGFLSSYSAIVDDELMSGIEIVDRVAIDNSTNPRLILALLEFRSKWVSQPQLDLNSINNPLGLYVPGKGGLYNELNFTAKLLNMGYYGWRSGELDKITFLDHKEMTLELDLNAGSAALLYLFSRLYNSAEFEVALRGNDNFILLHQGMFGDPWERAEGVEPILPEDLVQPDLELPFLPGEPWSFTGGPHSSWGTGTPRGALDFAPVTGEPACVVSYAWVTASAPGVVTRSERNLLALDLDGDGFEGTGWVLIYYHLADKDRLPLGSRVELDDPLGHPSCEGGQSTGTHVHIARKYNGEWLSASGDYPFVLSGWKVVEGTRAYEGFLIKDDVVITANPGGSRISIITR